MMWNKPWSMKEGFAIGAGLIAVGLMLQFSAGPMWWSALAYPVNVIMLAIFVLILVLAYVLKEKVYAFKFIKSYKMAVPALVYAVALTAIMGLTMQGKDMPLENDPLGITYMLSFWPFVLIYITMAFTLGLDALHKIVKGEWRKWPAIFSHLGLFIVLVCGTLGSADMQRLKMYCELGNPEWRALDDYKNTHELDIAIQLDSFTIAEYPPKVTLVDNKELKTVMQNGKPLSFNYEGGNGETTLGKWKVKVLQFLDYGAPKMANDSTMAFEKWEMTGAASALEVEASNGKTTKRGWITCGNENIPSQLLYLDNQFSLGMPQREPQKYSSKVHIMTKSGTMATATIEVNKPVTVDGWKIYQYSYNEKAGRWSDYSVFELVTDPWLPVVYVGIGMIAIGAIGMFIVAQRRKEGEK